MFCVIKSFAFVLLWTTVSAKISWDNKWFNVSSPQANGTEIEPPANATYLNNVCSAGTSGKLSIQCQDIKKEPINGVQKNDTNLHYFAVCSEQVGLICNPWVGYNASCPDFAIRYGCNLPDTTAGPTTTPKQGGQSGNGLNAGNNNNSGGSGNPAPAGNQGTGTGAHVTSSPLRNQTSGPTGKGQGQAGNSTSGTGAPKGSTSSPAVNPNGSSTNVSTSSPGVNPNGLSNLNGNNDNGGPGVVPARWSIGLVLLYMLLQVLF